MSSELLSQSKYQRDQVLGMRATLYARLKSIQESAAEVKTTISQVEGLLLSLEEFIAALDKDISESPTVPSESVQQEKSAANAARTQRKTARTQGNSKKEDVARAAYQAIKSAKRPLSRRELLDVLIPQNLAISGTNPEMVLSTMLWRAGAAAGVTRLPAGGYWLKDEDWPPAGYFADLLG